MRAAPKQALLRIVLLLAVAPALAAQPRCLISDTPRECVMRWLPGPGATANSAPATEAVQSTVASFSGGLSSIDAPVRTALKDFLSVLSGTLEEAVLGDDGTSLTFGYKLPVTLFGTRRPLLLEAGFARPQLSATTTALVTDPAVTAELQRSLTLLDDARASLTFSPATRRFGLDPKSHLTLWTAIYLDTLQKANADLEASVLQAVSAAGIAAGEADRRITDLAATPSARQALLTALAASAGSAFPPPAQQVTNDFAVLLGNQPQLFATVLYRFREDVIGPPERMARLTFEASGRNLNAFYRTEGQDCTPGSTRADFNAHCAAAFAAHVQRLANARRSHRLAVSFEYRSTSQVTVFPAGAFAPQEIIPTRSVVYSVVYGRPFTSVITGREGWIDFSLSYTGHTQTSVSTTGGTLGRPALEFLDEDVPRLLPPSTRKTAAITYTQPIDERVSIPVSLVYSDDIEYLPHRGPPVSPPGPPTVVVRRQDQLAFYVGLIYKAPSGPSPRSSRCPCCCS